MQDYFLPVGGLGNKGISLDDAKPTNAYATDIIFVKELYQFAFVLINFNVVRNTTSCLFSRL